MLSNVPKSIDLNVKPFDIELSRLDNNHLKADWTLFEYSYNSNNHITRKEQVNNFTEKME